jgi:hypothetical protein
LYACYGSSWCSKPIGCQNYWITSLHGKVVSCRILHPPPCVQLCGREKHHHLNVMSFFRSNKKNRGDQKKIFLTILNVLCLLVSKNVYNKQILRFKFVLSESEYRQFYYIKPWRSEPVTETKGKIRYKGSNPIQSFNCK